MSNQITTDCRNCVFRLNDDKGDQNGCELGRLEKYIKLGVAELVGDNASCAYTIGRACVGCKHKDSEWADRIEPKDRAKTLREQIKLRNTAVIFYDRYINYDKIDKMLLDIQAEEVPVDKVIFVTADMKASMGKLSNFMKKKAYKINYMLKRPVEDVGIQFLLDEILQDTAKRHKSLMMNSFFILLDQDKPYEPGINTKVNHLVNEELIRFTYMPSKHGFHLQFINPTVLDYVGLDSDGKTTEEKVREWAKAENTENMILETPNSIL